MTDKHQKGPTIPKEQTEPGRYYLYWSKQRRVKAYRFETPKNTNDPLPPGVSSSTVLPGVTVYCVLAPNGKLQYVANGDWVIEEQNGERHRIMAHEDFVQNYEYSGKAPTTWSRSKQAPRSQESVGPAQTDTVTHVSPVLQEAITDGTKYMRSVKPSPLDKLHNVYFWWTVRWHTSEDGYIYRMVRDIPRTYWPLAVMLWKNTSYHQAKASPVTPLKFATDFYPKIQEMLTKANEVGNEYEKSVTPDMVEQRERVWG